MPKEEDANRSKNVKFLIFYFTILIAVQASGIMLFLKYPSVLLGVVIGLSFGFLLPIGLAFLLIRILNPRKS